MSSFEAAKALCVPPGLGNDSRLVIQSKLYTPASESADDESLRCVNRWKIIRLPMLKSRVGARYAVAASLVPTCTHLRVSTSLNSRRAMSSNSASSFRTNVAEQMAIEHQLGRVFLLMDTAFKFAINGAVASYRPHMHRPR